MSRRGSKREAKATAVALALLLAASVAASPARAAVGPLYDIKATWGNTNLPPGGEGRFGLWVRHIGDEDSTEGLLIKDQLPAGVTATNFDFFFFGEDFADFFCTGTGTETVECFVPGEFLSIFLKAPGGLAGPYNPEPSGYMPAFYVDVAIDPSVSDSGTNTATVEGGAAPSPVSDVDQVRFDSIPSAFGIVPGSYLADFFDDAYPLGEPSRQAGAHPSELRVDFDFTQRLIEPSSEKLDTDVNALVKDVDVTLPPGMVGNPEATPKCNPTDFAEEGVSKNSTRCPSSTQVGYLNVMTTAAFEVFRNQNLSRVPIYNLEPPKGKPADFAFNAGGLVQGHIYPNVDPGQNYAITTLTPDISSLIPVRGAEATFWGVPGDPAHDKFRYYTKTTAGKHVGAPFGSSVLRPLFTNPSDCGFDNGGTRIRVSSYSEPGKFTPVEEYANPMNVEGCDDPRFRFEPDISMQPTSKAAGGPTGLAVNLEIPLRSDEVDDAQELYAKNGFVKGIATPPLKKAVVTFPEGMTVSPSAAQGLGACSPAQIGMGTDSAVTCPDSSQFGTLSLKTPILPIDEQPQGWVYVAKPFDNPFHNFLSLYLVIQEPDKGILVKLAGKAGLDPEDGQITFTFDDLPQLPVEEMTMNVKSGLRAGLVNPQTCGVKTIDATFFTWQDPGTPHSVKSSYEITHNPDGTPCRPSLSDRPFQPELSGGTVNNLAGTFSPLEIHFARSDEDQELSRVEGTAPPGLLASLRGVGRCSDAQIAAAADPARTGSEEQSSPSCPASSQVGTVDAGAGVGQVLTYVDGKVYLAGPYKGAPLSGVAIVPAVAGPFDLGVVVTRAPAYVDPRTAELRLVTDPLPQIFKGVPIRVRDVRVHVDRPGFILNPTSCAPMSLAGALFSTEGKSKLDGSPFQAADCGSLGFRPRLSTRLFGGTHRGAHPKFRGVYRARSGDANASRAVVALPRSAFLDQSHIRTVCTRVQFAADACPPGSIYGRAVAQTPLLEEALQGPVYLRSSDNKLPDLVADLHGIIDVEVSARIDSARGGIRASFESIPDAPVAKFTITMQGGRKGLLVNSRNICDRANRVRAGFQAQNGKAAALTPPLKATCQKKRRGGPRSKRPEQDSNLRPTP